MKTTKAINSTCLDCKHFWGIDSCDAFPDRIPDEILTGDNPHTNPLKDQENDIVFESIE